MLIFNRAAFRSGVMIVKETVADVDYAYILKPKDKGTSIAVQDEAQILAKYPSCFTTAP